MMSVLRIDRYVGRVGRHAVIGVAFFQLNTDENLFGLAVFSRNDDDIDGFSRAGVLFPNVCVAVPRPRFVIKTKRKTP